MKISHTKPISLLDLYSGLGGISIGFEMTGAYRVLAGLDNFDWAVRTFYQNHPEIGHAELKRPIDLSDFKPAQLLDLLGEAPDVIVGGPPCQGFSRAGRRLDDLLDDPRNHQVFNYFEFVKYLRPKIFMMENVSGITSTGQKRENDLLDLLERQYTDEGYKVKWQIMNSADYRVPQARKRLIMIGIRDSTRAFEFPEPVTSRDSLFSSGEKVLTVADALSDLPSPIATDPQPYESAAQTPLQHFLRKGSTAIYNHTPTKHSPEMTKRLLEQKVGTCLYDWNHSWFKLDPTRPAPTVKQNNRAPSVHYSEPRSSSVRECARLQTIPDRFVLPGTKTSQLILLGNAVPSIFAAHLGTAIAEQGFNREVPEPWDSRQSPLK